MPVTVTLDDAPADRPRRHDRRRDDHHRQRHGRADRPRAALRGTAGDYTVLVLGADGTPTAQPVEVGLVTNTTAEIKSGLTEGQAVVTGVANAQTGTADQRPAASAAAASRSRAAAAVPRRRPAASTVEPADERAPIISLDGVSRIYDMGRDGGARPGRREPRGRARRVRRDRRAVRLGQEHDDEHPRLPRPPDGGAYRLAGTPVADLDDDGLARLRSRTIGFVFQSYNLLPRTTRARQRRHAAALPGRRRGASARPGPGPRSSGSAWATASTTSRPSCPAASSSASPSPGLS